MKSGALKKTTHLLLVFALLLPQYIASAAKLEGLEETAKKSGYIIDKQSNAFVLTKTVAQAIQLALSFVGVFFLILIIYAGYLWMLAQGNEEKIEKSKKIIQNATIGIVIISLAYAITAFVGQFYQTTN